jgi:GNAT superfamily N-acetyltransferase
VPRNETHIEGEYLYRDVLPEDREQVLAFTANTWADGDYIDQVFDDWLANPSGRFLAVEHSASHNVVAIDKLTMLSPDEGWFEGLRIDPEHRGRGLAGRIQRFMLGEAAHAGARSIRLLTLATNTPIHRAAYRDGFSLLFLVRFWRWSADSGNSAETPSTDARLILRPAPRNHAHQLFSAWQQTSAGATHGLLHRGWSFSRATEDDWVRAAEEGRLLVQYASLTGEQSLPLAAVLVQHQEDDDHRRKWVISAATGVGEQWKSLAQPLCEAARRDGVAEITGLVPDTYEAYSGLLAAGFQPDSDDDRLCVFELANLTQPG